MPATTVADVVAEPTFWSCQTHEVSGLGGSVYDDVLESRYVYDSLVVNSRRIRIGDVLVLRDPHLVRGYGVVESIDAAPALKAMERCPRPECGSADVRRRQVKRPTYRCPDCHHEFDDPDVTSRDVVRYVAHYDATWSPLGSAVPAGALKQEAVYAKGDFPNAIRELDASAAAAFLRMHADLESALNLELLAHTRVIPGGHTDALAHVRRGQMQFREAMFARFGSVCAVTGSQPADVLDAAHLYSFAVRPEHRYDGGLLLRSDIHRLFDRLLITFDPASWSSRVAPPLLHQYESLVPLDGLPIAVTEAALPDKALVADHYAASRARWRDLASTLR